MQQRIAIVGSLLSLTLFVSPALAADKCTIIYGGGEMDCEATVSATVKPTATPKPGQTATTSGQGTTKGGLTVQETTNVRQTPATGPESLGLLALIPAAAAGFYLRRKK